MRIGWGLLCGLLMALSWGCRCSEEKPETQALAYLAELEAAVEAPDIGDFKALVAEDFEGQGQPGGTIERATLVQHLKLGLLAQSKVHVLTRLKRAERIDADHLQVEVQLAIARVPLPDDLNTESLSKLNARLLSVEATLRRDGSDWVAEHAEWSELLAWL